MLANYSQVVFQSKNLRSLAYFALERLKDDSTSSSSPTITTSSLLFFSIMVQSIARCYIDEQPIIEAHERDKFVAVLEFVVKNGQDYLGMVVKMLQDDEKEKEGTSSFVHMPFNQLAAYTFLCNCIFYRTIMANQKYEQNMELHSHSVENVTYAIEMLKDMMATEGDKMAPLFSTEHGSIVDSKDILSAEMPVIGAEPLSMWSQSHQPMPSAFRVGDTQHVVHLFADTLSIEQQLSRLYALRNHFQNVSKRVAQTKGTVLDDLHEALQLNPRDTIALSMLAKDLEENKQSQKSAEQWLATIDTMPRGHFLKPEYAYRAARLLLQAEFDNDDKLAKAFKDPADKDNASYLRTSAQTLATQINAIFEHYSRGAQFARDADSELAPFNEELHRRLPNRDKLSVELFLAWSSPDRFGDLAKCAHCGKTGVENLKRCAGCRSVLYCGRDCQKSAWTSHKIECKQIKQEGNQ